VLAGAHCPIGRRRPHCALYDALASALLLLRMEEEADLAGRVSLHWLLRISEGVSAQQELF
jgi:DNA polymerase III epsilon subunit-like protein